MNGSLAGGTDKAPLPIGMGHKIRWWGGWKDPKFNGQGTFTNAKSGRVEEAIFKNGKLVKLIKNDP